MAGVIVRAMTHDDLPALIDVQEAGAVISLAEVFPQERFPFPRAAILARWREELEDAAIGTYVAIDDDGRLVGFAATRGPELLHFGTAVPTWGRGVAAELLAVVVDVLRATGAQPRLLVFAGNVRARRFYEKHGWHPTGARTASSFEPHPVLLEYALPAA